MNQGIETLVRYLNQPAQPGPDSDPIIQRLAAAAPWPDVRSGISFMVQWLATNAIRRVPEPMPIYPRFAKAYGVLLSESKGLREIFEIVGETMAYRSNVTGSARAAIETYIVTNWKPETVV